MLIAPAWPSIWRPLFAGKTPQSRAPVAFGEPSKCAEWVHCHTPGLQARHSYDRAADKVKRLLLGAERQRERERERKMEQRSRITIIVELAVGPDC